MYENVIELVGTEPGPTSMILAGVHGNEWCGIDALSKILPSLVIEKGKVLIAYGNPKAIEEKVRFTDSNLNRLFRDDDMLSEKERASYEYARAQFLKKYLDQADVLLDIHASSIPNSKKFVICEKKAKEIVKYLPVELVVSGFDNVEPGGTDYFMNSIGKIGICVECGHIGDSDSSQIAEENIVAFLKAMGHIAHNMIPQKQSYVQMQSKYFAKTDSFILSKSFENFETIEIDQLIGVDGQEEIRAIKQGVILFAHNSNRAGDEVFLLGEEKISLA